ncbi:MAG: IPTL-CTERM sorting domain-containing protein, partial [Cytophagaceae bacterium]
MTFCKNFCCLLVLLAGLLGGPAAWAQRRKAPVPRARAGTPKGRGDFFRAKAPTMRYVRPDTTT